MKKELYKKSKKSGVNSVDYQQIREKAVDWMLGRGWKKKIAKKKEFEQSLFEHTLIEIDALITLLPVLEQPAHYGLSEKEKKVLIAGVVAHDVGKETKEWQEYIYGGRSYEPHVVDGLTDKTVCEIVNCLGFTDIDEPLRSMFEVAKDSWKKPVEPFEPSTSEDGHFTEEAKSAVKYHMSSMKTPAALIFDTIKGDKSDRWLTLANIVSEIDNICSAKGIFSAKKGLERSILGQHLKSSYHFVYLRGVSTTLLHHAAIDAFSKNGWLPLIHYSNGTLYVADSAVEVKDPSVEPIRESLAGYIAEAMGEKFIEAVVTKDFRASAIAKPELFDYREVGSFLKKAATRVGGGTNRFVKKIESSRGRQEVEKLISSYLKLADGQEPALTEEMLMEHSQRISAAYPEMCIFKFFKAAVAEDIVGKEVDEEARKKYVDLDSDGKSGKITPGYIAQVEYDRVFGEGAFKKLQSTSTLMPAKDMALAVDSYWQSPGSRFDMEEYAGMELAPDEKRREKLIEVLTAIAGKVYESLPEEDRPVRATPFKIAGCFMPDLIYPAKTELEILRLVHDQLEIYEKSKLNTKKEKGEHLCPVCNQHFGSGAQAKADFLAKPESHTNRAVAHSSAGERIVICDACKYERFIRQLLLGAKAEQILVLFPRMNIAHDAGMKLVKKAEGIYDRALSFMSNDTRNPCERITLSLTQLIARKLFVAGHHIPFGSLEFRPEDIVELLTYESAEDKRKKYRKSLEEKLKEDIGAQLDDLNALWGTDFAAWEEAIEALIKGEVIDTVALSIREEVYKLRPDFRIIAQTPHMILFVLQNPLIVGDKESETNSALRQLFIMLLLGSALDCSVALIGDGETIDFGGGEGIARVPKVPAVRDLIGKDWVGISEAKKWLYAIGAAGILANATDFPERSNLYQILTAATAGHILRRIEQKSKGGMVSYRNYQLLETVREVLR